MLEVAYDAHGERFKLRHDALQKLKENRFDDAWSTDKPLANEGACHEVRPERFLDCGAVDPSVHETLCLLGPSQGRLRLWPHERQAINAQCQDRPP